MYSITWFWSVYIYHNSKLPLTRLFRIHVICSQKNRNIPKIKRCIISIAAQYFGFKTLISLREYVHFCLYKSKFVSDYKKKIYKSHIAGRPYPTLKENY